MHEDLRILLAEAYTELPCEYFGSKCVGRERDSHWIYQCGTHYGQFYRSVTLLGDGERG